jgi:biopolymer transport protein ExbD
MMRSGRGRRGSLPLTAEINVASLVDVAFTLLVIFIIAAPILQGGVEVQLPRASAAPITAHDGVIVTVTREGALFIGDFEVESMEDFLTVYPQYVKDKEVQSVYVRGDRDVSYGRVLQVIGAMKKLDVAEVGLVADPELDS